MKKILIIFIITITFMLTGCNAEETNPIEKIGYSLYDFDGDYVYDIFDLSGEIKFYDYIYIAGVFDKEGIPTLMTFGYDVERDEFRPLGEKEVIDCSYVKIVDEEGYTPWIIFENNGEYYFEYFVGFGGYESLRYNDYSYENLLSEYFKDDNPEYFKGFKEYDSLQDYIISNPTSDMEYYLLESYAYTIDGNGIIDITVK